MHCCFVSNPLNVELKSHVVSVVLLIHLMCNMCSSTTSRLFTKAFNRLSQRVLNSSVGFAFLESISVNGLGTVAGEELTEDRVEHYCCHANSQQYHAQVTCRLHSLLDFFSQRLCLADVFTTFRSRNGSAVIR